MSPEAVTVVRVFASVGLVGVLIVGFLVGKNFQRWFGRDPNMPSENASHRTYAIVMVVLVWIHAAAITALVALGWH